MMVARNQSIMTCNNVVEDEEWMNPMTNRMVMIPRMAKMTRIPRMRMTLRMTVLPRMMFLRMTVCKSILY